MPRLTATLVADRNLGRFRKAMRLVERRMETAALIATDAAARQGLRTIRQQMASAGLGRLGNALGSTSDMERTGSVYRRADGWSASGTIYVRSGSPRSRGAIEAYTRGADIRPVRSRWLWIPSDDIPRVSQRERLTPALWRRNGLDRKIGPLFQIRSDGGFPLLVARNVGVSAAGAKRSVKSLTKSGRPRKGQVQKEIVVAFIGIPRTSRQARIDVRAIIAGVMNDMPRLFDAALARTAA